MDMEVGRDGTTEIDDRVDITRPVSDIRNSGAPLPMDIDAPILDDGFGGQLDENLLDDVDLFADQPFEGFEPGAIGQDIEFGGMGKKLLVLFFSYSNSN